MKRARLRSGLVTGALLISAAIAFLYLAPTQIGGSTSYVITHGDSMEPRFHAGDLALVRPADDYRVGQIVAYHSTVLRVVVLHRIVGRDGDRYIFKGDHNKFLDPVRPTKAQLIGALWVRVPHGGIVLAFLHLPLIAAILTGVCAIILLVGAGKKRRRRARRRNAAAAGRHGASQVHPHSHHAHATSNQAILVACIAVMVVTAALGVIAFARPTRKPASSKVSYGQQVSFGYSATATAGPVYPTGTVNTGDPVFRRLVNQVTIRTSYKFFATAPHAIAGTEAVVLTLSGPSGWGHTIQLAPPRPFVGDRVTRTATIDLRSVQALLTQIGSLTGVGAEAGSTLTVVPRVHVRGTVAGKPIDAKFNPQLSFQLSPLELQLGDGTGASGGSTGGLTQTTKGTVASTGTTSNTLDVAGVAPTVTAVRWGAIIAFVLALATALLVFARLQRQPPDAAARIWASYGDIIVPIAAIADDPGRPVIDVTSIKALAQLARVSERLILHHHGENVDTYLVEDEGTVYRYRTRPAAVVEEPPMADRETPPEEEPERQPAAPAEEATVETEPAPATFEPEPVAPQPVAAQPAEPEPIEPEPEPAEAELVGPEPFAPSTVGTHNGAVTHGEVEDEVLVAEEPGAPHEAQAKHNGAPPYAWVVPDYTQVEADAPALAPEREPEPEPAELPEPPEGPEPLPAELNGSPDNESPQEPAAWRALDLLADADLPTLWKPPTSPRPKLPATLRYPRRRRGSWD